MNPIAPRVKIERIETKFTVKRGASWTKIIQIIPIPIEISKPNFIESNISKKFCFDYKLAVFLNFYWAA